MLTGEGFHSFSAMIQLLCAAQAHKMPGVGFKMEYSPGLGKDGGAAEAASGKAFFLEKKKNKPPKTPIISHKRSSPLRSVMSQMVLQEVVEAGDNPSPGCCPLSGPAGDSRDWD